MPIATIEPALDTLVGDVATYSDGIFLLVASVVCFGIALAFMRLLRRRY